MEWYEGVSDEQIAQLKNNKQVLGLCPDMVRDRMKEIPRNDLQYYSRSRAWKECATSFDRAPYPNDTYRLRPDWERPKPEKKEPKWEVGKVELDRAENQYYFWHNLVFHTLPLAVSIKGYDGTTFKEWPGLWLAAVNMWVDAASNKIYHSPGEGLIPATPVQVRFRRS